MMPFLVSRMPSLVNASVAVLPLTHHLQKKKSTVPIFSDENNMTMEVARYCKKKNDLGYWEALQPWVWRKFSYSRPSTYPSLTSRSTSKLPPLAQALHMRSLTVSRFVLGKSRTYHSLPLTDMLSDVSLGTMKQREYYSIPCFPGKRNNSIFKKFRILKGILKKSQALITWMRIHVDWESGLWWFCAVHWMSQDQVAKPTNNNSSTVLGLETHWLKMQIVIAQSRRGLYDFTKQLPCPMEPTVHSTSIHTRHSQT